MPQFVFLADQSLDSRPLGTGRSSHCCMSQHLHGLGQAVTSVQRAATGNAKSSKPCLSILWQKKEWKIRGYMKIKAKIAEVAVAGVA